MKFFSSDMILIPIAETVIEVGHTLVLSYIKGNVVVKNVVGYTR